jgi:hypothetical protein
MRTGLCRPTSEVDRPFRGPVEVYRCDADGGVVVPTRQSSLSAHAGHRLRQPVLLRPHEVALLWLGVIR